MNPDTRTDRRVLRVPEPVDRRPPSPPTSGVRLFWPLATVALVLVVSVIALLAPGDTATPTTDPGTPPAPQEVHHDSGIDRLLRERDEAAEHHDSGIDRALRDRAEYAASHHDSGIDRLLRERAEVVR